MNRKIGVVGLGYVGLPVAVAFGQKYPVVGFDVSKQRIKELKQNIDYNSEVLPEEFKKTEIEFITNAEKLEACDFIIVAVPTPISKVKHPELTPLIRASETVGANLQPGAIVVYESTVYPGVTEEICLPILEKFSGLVAGEDFFVGYSPERINPGDKEHTFTNIVKVVSGQDKKTLEIIAGVYGSVVEAGVHRASSIKVAEAAKVIENTQRDLNIALMNELAIIFNRLGIDTNDVLEAAATKWNFLRFTPGLVGGHCIGVDPYYLTFKAESTGYHPQVILAGRRINDGMGQFIATSLVKQMILKGIAVPGARVTVLGLTFKENVSDLRNSKVVDIISELKEFGVEVQVTDPLTDSGEAQKEYGVQFLPLDELQAAADAVVLAVPHREYLDMGWRGVLALLSGGQGVVADVKGVLDVAAKPEQVMLWRL